MTTYIFSYVLKPWFFPPGFQILLAVLALLIYKFSSKASKALIFISILSLWLFSMPIFAYNLIEILQNRYTSLQISKNLLPGIIVVLGGGNNVSIEKNNQLSVSETTLNRLRYAAYLHRLTQFPILVSGGCESGSSISEAELMRQSLQEDFHTPVILKEDKSQTTAEEAKYLAPILQRNNFLRVYLVTNAWHMPRSMESFKRAKMNVIAAPMGYQIYDHHYTLLSFLPNINALHTSVVAMHEWIGMIWYRMNHL